jgi:hypothetical protein
MALYRLGGGLEVAHCTLRPRSPMSYPFSRPPSGPLQAYYWPTGCLVVAYPLARPRLARGLRQVFGAPWRSMPVAGASGGGPFCQWPGPAGLEGCYFCAAGASKDRGCRVPRAFPPADVLASRTEAPHAMTDNSKQKGDSMNLTGVRAAILRPAGLPQEGEGSGLSPGWQAKASSLSEMPQIPLFPTFASV